MHSRHEHSGLVWIDLESPTRDEVQALIDEFSIEPRVAEELLLPATKPHVDFHASYVYLILHFPALRHSHKHRGQELDFVIGRNFLVTTHYEAIDPVHNFSKVFEVNSALETGKVGNHAGYIFYALLKRLYKGVEHELEFIKRDLTTIEEHIFSGDEVLMVESLSRAARDLLNLRQILEPHREVLHTLESEGANFFAGDFSVQLRALSNEYYKVHNHIMRLTEQLHELRETNNSLLSTKQNETMKVFTIMAFTTFPLTLFATLFAIPAESTPILGRENDFWILVSCMAFAVSLMLMFFKRKKWL
jgi:magnesium transporter